VPKSLSGVFATSRSMESQKSDRPREIQIRVYKLTDNHACHPYSPVLPKKMKDYRGTPLQTKRSRQ
jgi:hypothetical protein